MLKKMKEVGSKLETVTDTMGKVKEGNESITQIAGTETTTIEVTKLVEQKITENFMKKRIRDKGETR